MGRKEKESGRKIGIQMMSDYYVRDCACLMKQTDSMKDIR